MEQYRVIECASAFDLQARVTEALRKEWRLVGGLAVTSDHGGVAFCQAVVRTPPELEEEDPRNRNLLDVLIHNVMPPSED